MVIPVPTEPKDIIKAYLLCLNPILKLKPREIELLNAMLMVYYNLKKSVKSGQMTIAEIDVRLNDPMGRKITRDLINMSEASHNNHFIQLKKKRVITEDGKLQDFLKNLDKQDLTVQYKISLNKPSAPESNIVKRADIKEKPIVA